MDCFEYEEIREKDPNEKEENVYHLEWEELRVYYREIPNSLSNLKKQVYRVIKIRVVRRGSQPFEKDETVYYKDNNENVCISWFNLGVRKSEPIIRHNGLYAKWLAIPHFVFQQYSPYEARKTFYHLKPPTELHSISSKQERIEKDEKFLRGIRKEKIWKKDVDLISKDITDCLLSIREDKIKQAKAYGLDNPRRCEINCSTYEDFMVYDIPHPKFIEEEIVNFYNECKSEKHRRELLDKWYSSRLNLIPNNTCEADCQKYKANMSPQTKAMNHSIPSNQTQEFEQEK